MNCPTCKNPNEDNILTCEWCGHNMMISELTYEYCINFYFDDGKYIAKKNKLMVFVDKIMVLEFFIYQGCNFDYCFSNNKPDISVSLDNGKTLYKIVGNPNFDYSNKKYRITWKKNFWGIIHFDKPIIFRVN
jgi:hypothetical protein